MIVWINGSYGAGKTTTSEELVGLLPAARLFDAEEVGYMLHHVLGPLQEEADFQHWPPWRALVVETARQLLAYTGGTLVIPQTVLVEEYWTELREGLGQLGVPVRHFVLHADPGTLTRRIEADIPAIIPWRLDHVVPYQEALPWLRRAGEVIDTTDTPPDEVARRIAAKVAGREES
ncbi:AAA family ATPase [Streptomyces sp. BA2]|uniref:AAA family ATPase n=1 Tax=Streptomyces sp. BA2 TaxID=436595 RepID=UPI0013225B44|nr:AAA family ATPase [Streptomyces sp. BA2]